MKHKSGVLASSAARSTTNEECDKPNVRSSKRRGEVVELAFLYKAVSLGFGVAKPYGDSECYDFIVDWSGDSGAPNSHGDSHGLVSCPGDFVSTDASPRIAISPAKWSRRFRVGANVFPQFAS